MHVCRRFNDTAEGRSVDDAGVKLVVIGCSPAWHNPGGAESGYVVEGEQRLLLDCGPGVFSRLRKRDGWPRIDAIAITHFHLDHWGDLVPWTFGASFGPGRGTPTPELWLPPDGKKTLETFTSKLNADPLFDAFSVREYAEGVAFHAAGFEIVPYRVLHYDLLAFGFRVINGGKVLAYSGDSGPSPALAALAHDADLFVCEATLAQPEPAMRGHLTEQEALAAHRESGAKRLLIVHRPDELPLDEAPERAWDGYETDV
jgi:ribonuclease BN (tRNA processing enzyme)